MKNLKGYKKLSESYFAGSEKPILVRSYFQSGDTIQVIVNEGVPFPTMDELRNFVDMLRPRRLQYMCVVYTLKGKNYVSEIDLVELLGGIKNEEDEKKIQKNVVQGQSRRNPSLIDPQIMPAFGNDAIKDICSRCTRLEPDGHCAHEEIVDVSGCSYFSTK